MILIDTDVISELMRSDPDPAVLDWFSGQDVVSLYLIAISEAELRRGVEILPDERRKTALKTAIDAMVAEDFADRVLSFDGAAAVAFAAIFAERRAAGRPIGLPDCQIAATARARGAAVATRNVDGFKGCGIAVANPWEGAANG